MYRYCEQIQEFMYKLSLIIALNELFLLSIFIYHLHKYKIISIEVPLYHSFIPNFRLSIMSKIQIKNAYLFDFIEFKIKFGLYMDISAIINYRL